MIARFLPWLIALAAIAALVFAAERWGYSKGYAAASGECQQANIKRLDAALTGIETLTAKAEAANIELGKTISNRILADAKAAGDIRDALKTTAHLRVECVLPDGVMQQLTAARERANTAAASGINHSVPAAAATDR